ncbi:MAG: CDP-glycerol glycerophosphotransferase family protein, partial [Lachnospiraceae bacterium]|nr:CDP-glycerol glycerophosphotransferase family protein [Lachnospiraceae bacterium]
SRTDYYFDEAWNRRCRENFQRQHPEAVGKKIAVWAPTFRGNAAEPRLEGLEAVQQAAWNLKDDWYLIIKAHPHVDRHGMVSNSAIPTEELLPVADVLITDYSSVLFDYLLYRKPAVLFATDLEEYEQIRGFYIDYQSIPFPIVKTGAELEAELRILACQDMQEGERGSTGKSVVRRAALECDSSIAPEGAAVEGDLSVVSEEAAEYKKGRHEVHWPAADWQEAHAQEIDAFRETYVGACDGRSTERILQLIGLD